MKAGKNQQVVMRLVDAVSENDKDRIQSFLADDSVYYNLEGDKSVGRKAIWRLISSVHDQAKAVDWQLDELHEDEEGCVLTAGRVRYLIDNDWREYEVNGAFEVRGSKIAKWRRAPTA